MLDLFRSDNVVVRSVPASDVSRWVVTFDNYGIGHGFDRPGFGQEFLRGAGISAIHVLGAREDWYQYPEMAAAMASVRQAVAGADRVMTYGSSMGGYAALRFADAAGANAALALSPQYSIDPRKAPFEKRWIQDSRRIRWLPEIDGRLTCAARPVVVFDPTAEDGRHIALIQKDIAITAISLPYVSHPATTYLGEVGLLKSLVLQTLSGELDGPAFNREGRLARRRSSLYISNLAQSQPSHRQGLALSLARLSVEKAPGNPLTGVALARILSRAGEHDQAVAEMERVTVLTRGDPNYLVHFVNALMAANRPAEALSTAREVVNAWPHMAHLHAWESAVLWAAGEYDAAVEATTRAITLDPQDKKYPRLLKNYRQKMAGTRVQPSGPWRWIRRWSASLARARPQSAP
ncbi:MULTISPECIES: tetratricopeptide repeat protein [unclassified Brevundimonas]|uniref:tetratricopeptide repeat protein n=1 Tax=unclassified Brevundimonas TaxID=2622653 RepID=UPI000E92B1D6|nr:MULTISPECIES: tetratricopeptide repeat protein [unclassified Brevundimonas]HBY44295.1 alpha/beta hydrolase [Brevundimonas sp.]